MVETTRESTGEGTLTSRDRSRATCCTFARNFRADPRGPRGRVTICPPYKTDEVRSAMTKRPVHLTTTRERAGERIAECIHDLEALRAKVAQTTRAGLPDLEDEYHVRRQYAK